MILCQPERQVPVVYRLPGYTIIRYSENVGGFAFAWTVKEVMIEVFKACKIFFTWNTEPHLVVFRGERLDAANVVGGTILDTGGFPRALPDGSFMDVFGFHLAVADEDRCRGIGGALLSLATQRQHLPAREGPCLLSLWVVNPKLEPVLAGLGLREVLRHRDGTCDMEKPL